MCMGGWFVCVCVAGGDCVIPGPKGSRQDAKIAPCSLLLQCKMFFLLKGSSFFFPSPAKTCENRSRFRLQGPHYEAL